ncbi:hypothetical protein OHC33_004837 [Knufia fluminis]|uniref:non-reducing end alpha-L-arabinofuranosidase n=1 Tax=Knufia fluminis TaxID=191047 RepID=A0AAN8EF87_9EURO|nr:hypothetical protein OHC33_004837 [Knufia fluminis]
MSPQTASIHVFPSHRQNEINRHIYSGFTEHMGRCIEGGIYDPNNPNKDLLTPKSLRKDVISTLKPLDIPIFRYPGGNFTATYHWQDGVGPVDQRPTRLNLAWGGQPETNSFGTNEFMAWCRDHMNAEPYLCLNMGTGTLDEALAWIEYCNATGDSYYAKLRREHTGHDRPHNVKYWGLGNEVWGPWQIAQTKDPKLYAETALQWAKAIKLLDPSVKLILCGSDGMQSVSLPFEPIPFVPPSMIQAASASMSDALHNTFQLERLRTLCPRISRAWDYEVIKATILPATTSDLGVTQGPLIDYVSIHGYTASQTHYPNVFAPLSAERAIETTTALIDLACAANNIPPGQPRPTIAFDEWNVWDPKRAVGSQGAEEKYTLSDALAVAVWLNVFVRQSDKVGMACLAQSVNVISPLMTTETGLIKQTSWFVYELFCRFVRGHKVDVVVNCGCYQGDTSPAWLRDSVKGREMRWLDVSASVDGEGWCVVCVVNAHEGEDIVTAVGGVDGGTEVEVYEVNGKSVDVTNMDGEEKVGICEKRWVVQGEYVFPAHSFTMLRFRVSERK